MYERSRVNVKVEPRSTFTFTRGLSYIASILFTRVKFSRVRTEKLCDSGNQTLSARPNGVRPRDFTVQHLIKRQCNK